MTARLIILNPAADAVYFDNKGQLPRAPLPRDQARSIHEDYSAKAARAVETLDRGLEDAIAVLALPGYYRRKLRTTNSVERLNEEIRRRERVIRIFPNRASAVRMVGALLIEQHEEWSEGRKYFDMTPYWDWKAEQENPGSKLSRITA